VAEFQTWVFTHFPALRKYKWAVRIVIGIELAWAFYAYAVRPVLDTIGRYDTIKADWPVLAAKGLAGLDWLGRTAASPVSIGIVCLTGFAFLYLDRKLERATPAPAFKDLKVMIEETFLEPRVPESDTRINYKAKFGIGFVNLSGRTIHFLAPSWQSQPDDAGVQTPFWYRYRLPSDGPGRWRKLIEREDVTIEPNGRFRLSVGLDKACSQEELENRRRSGKLGTLLVPIEIGSDRGTLEYHV